MHIFSDRKDAVNEQSKKEKYDPTGNSLTGMEIITVRKWWIIRKIR